MSQDNEAILYEQLQETEKLNHIHEEAFYEAAETVFVVAMRTLHYLDNIERLGEEHISMEARFELQNLRKMIESSTTLYNNTRKYLDKLAKKLGY